MEDRRPNVEVELTLQGFDVISPDSALSSVGKRVDFKGHSSRFCNLVNHLCPESTSTIISEQGSDDGLTICSSSFGIDLEQSLFGVLIGRTPHHVPSVYDETTSHIHFECSSSVLTTYTLPPSI
jgi:hypothetical protein